MVEAIRKEDILGIDLENYNKNSYNGFLCLMQITTKDYITYVLDLLPFKRSLL